MNVRLHRITLRACVVIQSVLWNLIQPVCPVERENVYYSVNSRLQSFCVLHKWPLCFCLLPDPPPTQQLQLFERLYWCFSVCCSQEDEWNDSNQFCQFYQCILGNFNYMPCLLWNETIWMPSVSSQLFPVFILGEEMGGSKYLCFINGLWKC